MKMKNFLSKWIYVAVVIIVTMFGGSTQADVVLAFTSFENDMTGNKYFDTGDPSVDHDLVNNAGEANVDSTTLIDLGFDARYVNTRNDVGLTDGDFVGATSFTGTVGSFTDGTQGYQMSDTDGRMDLFFDAVNISGQGNVTVELDYFLQNTGYESTDSIRIYVDVDGTQTDLLNLSGDAMENFGAWNTLVTTVSGSTAFLGVEFDSNSGSEAVYLDRVSFFVAAIPEPSSVVVLGFITSCALIRRRKPNL